MKRKTDNARKQIKKKVSHVVSGGGGGVGHYGHRYSAEDSIGGGQEATKGLLDS